MSTGLHNELSGRLTDLSWETQHSGVNANQRRDMAGIRVMLWSEGAMEFSLLLNSARSGEIIEAMMSAVVMVSCSLEGTAGNGQW